MQKRVFNFGVLSPQVDQAQKSSCVGCSNCANVCPKEAIEMKYDEEGFLYPFIDESACINCGLCLKKCPLTNLDDTPNSYLKVVAGYAKDREVLLNSTSGGFATTLSNWFVDNGGVVFGVGYTEDSKKAIYQCASDRQQLKAFRGSKYIQSEKENVFCEIQKTLNTGKNVLFTGCPCDVSALFKYIGRKYDNLYVCELFCMGVTSNRILNDYISYTEKLNKSKLLSLNMRSKKYGWYVAALEEKFSSKSVKYSPFYSSYLGYGFLTYIRPSCLYCKYRGKNSQADFKAGDMWGGSFGKKYMNSLGTSCIVVQTEKGIDLLEKLSPMFYYEDIPTSILQNNPSLTQDKSVEYIEKRNQFSYTLKKYGLIEACKKHASLGFKIKRMVPGRFQPLIKSVYHYFIDK